MKQIHNKNHQRILYKNYEIEIMKDKCLIGNDSWIYSIFKDSKEIKSGYHVTNVSMNAMLLWMMNIVDRDILKKTKKRKRKDKIA